MDVQLRILFALAGLHRVHRGAEVAFLAVASELAKTGHAVTLIGSGEPRADDPYRFLHAGCTPRERFENFPKVPFLRGETSWEEATFLPGLLRQYRPSDYDVTLTCSFPFTNLALRRPVLGGKRPPHVFVTQNGDWPAIAGKSEFRAFGCEGLVCINPDYFERNQENYRCSLIPNGVDLDRFTPGPGDRARFGIPADRKIVLMVSALIGSKNVGAAIAAMREVPDAMLVVAGDGPIRAEIHAAAEQSIPGRFLNFSVTADQMPALYRSADAFLHLSRDESFGNVYVEALASGLPVIAYDLPRTRWIVGDDANFASPDDPAHLPVVIRAAIAGGPANGAANVERAKRFAWSAIAAQYGDFLSEVVQAGTRRDA